MRLFWAREAARYRSAICSIISRRARYFTDALSCLFNVNPPRRTWGKNDMADGTSKPAFLTNNLTQFMHWYHPSDQSRGNIWGNVEVILQIFKACERVYFGKIFHEAMHPHHERGGGVWFGPVNEAVVERLKAKVCQSFDEGKNSVQSVYFPF
jgi:hypothetical protein